MCYYNVEVSKMEENQLENQNESAVPEQGNVPRPAWQIWGARALLVIFILLLIMYYTNLFRG